MECSRSDRHTAVSLFVTPCLLQKNNTQDTLAESTALVIEWLLQMLLALVTQNGRLRMPVFLWLSQPQLAHDTNVWPCEKDPSTATSFDTRVSR